MAHFLRSRNCKGFDQPLRAWLQSFINADPVDVSVGVAATRSHDRAPRGAHIDSGAVRISGGFQGALLKVNLDAGAGGDPNGVRRRDSQCVFPAGQRNHAVRFAGLAVQVNDVDLGAMDSPIGQRPAHGPVCNLSGVFGGACDPGLDARVLAGLAGPIATLTSPISIDGNDTVGGKDRAKALYKGDQRRYSTGQAEVSQTQSGIRIHDVDSLRMPSATSFFHSASGSTGSQSVHCQLFSRVLLRKLS